MIGVKHCVCVLDEQSGHEGIYIDAELVEQDTTIYACDIVKACEGKTVELSHIVVRLPDNSVGFPQQFEKLMPLLIEEKEGQT